ncbi:PEP-CTERM sorting domain-containing protein [Massilia orientalis]|uniref:PEP-CTERM sorting domain-containing protein n=1 Tax=Massilia orientalis TaxID=3050128 RepID=A0ACC7M9E9_9BURK|nr:PEP-CTERM sorting domain-containing protein [Massilia sp. YIM B02787]
MKKILTFIASLVLAGAAQAAPIGFEDVATGGDFASLSDLNPYAGLNWSSDWFAGDTSIDGYANGAHSGSNFAVNGFGDNLMSVSSASGFNFAGAWFATPAGVGEKAGWINISAYDAANHLIGSTGNFAIGDDYTWLSAGFSDVALLNITSDSGWYAMDDFTTAAAAATVPEPGTQLMLGIGLLALVAGRRRSSL